MPENSGLNSQIPQPQIINSSGRIDIDVVKAVRTELLFRERIMVLHPTEYPQCNTTAQQKVIEYQTYLKVAEQRARQL